METLNQLKWVDIMILFYNKVDQTISCINSFLPSGQDIYVLNNGSDTEQVALLKQTFADNEQVHLLEGGGNLGVSGGRNFLIKQTKAPWLLSVDNDITIEPSQDWFVTFQKYIAQHPSVEIVAPIIYNVHEQAYSQQLKVRIEDNRFIVDTGSYEVTNCFPGGASIIKRSLFDNYGLFDEGMFVGFEDYEYALRALLSDKGSFEVHHIETIKLIHDHQYQKKASDKKAVKQRYNEEKLTASYNRLIEKYGIAFDHDWQWWTRKQVADMTDTPWKKFKALLHRFVKG